MQPPLPATSGFSNEVTRPAVEGARRMVRLLPPLLSALAWAGCGSSSTGIPTAASMPSPTPTPTPTCPAAAGTGERISVTINSVLNPSTQPQHTVTVQLPFLITGQGTVEAVTTIDPGFSTCTCVGLPQICRPGCSTGGLHTARMSVCESPQVVPGQWQFTIYCTGDSRACQTPLTRPLQATTTVTYTPTGN